MSSFRASARSASDEHHRLVLGLEGLLDLLLLQLLELQEHLAQVPLEHVLLHLQLLGGLLEEGAALPGGVEVEGVDVEALACGDEQVHAELLEAEVLAPGRGPGSAGRRASITTSCSLTSAGTSTIGAGGTGEAAAPPRRWSRWGSGCGGKLLGWLRRLG